MGVDAVLVAQVKRHEGLRLRAYPDVLSPLGKALSLPLAARLRGWQQLSGAPWSIGHGHTGPEVHEGLVWLPSQCDVALLDDLAHACSLLGRVAPWSSQLSPPRLRVLQDMIYNMGWDNPKTPKLEGLSGFVNLIGCCKRGDWDGAAAAMLDSDWARQTKSRAVELAEQMRSGEQQPPGVDAQSVAA